ncbi:helix-turn-helix domain-containing protein [Paeniglutamicibacter sulfureus]|uniref:helix-turn-helix domain-containing protein n=1 Tax=Paeniglutamicibacter sulfureus TaxID=43666 RepID=UPI00286A01E4|nr:helix-turn-helix domain-containing protein [Paeniglutamicibacter sulfureus]
MAEAAAAMRVPRMTVYDLVQEGKLPAVSFGKSFRIPARAVREFLAAARHPAAPAPCTRRPRPEPIASE